MFTKTIDITDFEFITAILETIYVVVIIVIAVLNKDKGGNDDDI